MTPLGGLFALATMSRSPAGATADLTRTPEWWPFDLPSWRALVRIAPLGAAEGLVWGAWFIVDGLPDSAVVDAVETVLLVVLALGLMVAVGLSYRPQLLVSPPLRDLPGALEEWRPPERL